MQTQQHSVSLHPDIYHTAHGMQSTMSDQYVATSGGEFLSGFSRGSSLTYPHQDCRCLLDRGGSLSRLSSTGANNLDATGIGFTGTDFTSTVFCAEEIAEYEQPWQQWVGTGGHINGLPAPIIQVASRVPEPFVSIKSAADQAALLRTPSAQLPTPASMAVLLNPNARSESQSAQVPYAPPAPAPQSQESPIPPQNSATRATRLAEAIVASDSQSREKKHACTMCHKRFDRPSTLKKHLLVHTGEKAFVCETCGRRFGVASNLNRHVRRCVLKPVNTSLSSSKSPSATPTMSAHPQSEVSTNTPTTSSTSIQMSMNANRRLGTKRVREASSSESTPDADDCHNTSRVSQSSQQPTVAKQKQNMQKRRRRPPSPSQWIPYSLLAFNLISDDYYKAAPVPLPPVRRNPPKEERDSWDESVGSAPYHPRGWKGVLPGPGLGLNLGLGGKDVHNINLGGSGGFMLGRVLVF